MKEKVVINGESWNIERDPKPIPTRDYDWDYWHEDYDGAEDAIDNRCGNAKSKEDAILQIKEIEGLVDGKSFTVFCPKCHEEEFEATVTNSESGPDEWGTCHWWEGYGKCANCKYADYYSDSSH